MVVVPPARLAAGTPAVQKLRRLRADASAIGFGFDDNNRTSH